MNEPVTTLWGEVGSPPAIKPPKHDRGTIQSMTREERIAYDNALYDAARERARQREHRRWLAGNPMLKTVGTGPFGVTCNACRHLLRLRYHSQNYLKCELRGVSHGTGTDHRAKWSACSRFEPQQEGGAS